MIDNNTWLDKADERLKEKLAKAAPDEITHAIFKLKPKKIDPKLLEPEPKFEDAGIKTMADRHAWRRRLDEWNNKRVSLELGEILKALDDLGVNRSAGTLADSIAVSGVRDQIQKALQLDGVQSAFADSGKLIPLLAENKAVQRGGRRV